MAYPDRYPEIYGYFASHAQLEPYNIPKARHILSYYFLESPDCSRVQTEIILHLSAG